MLPNLYQDWFENIATDDSVQIPALPDPQALLTQLRAENPQLAGLIRLMAMRQQAETKEAQEDDEDFLIDAPSVYEKPVPEISNLMRRLYNELEELRQRNDILADALGACYLCWGDDFNCPECNGQGRPGAAPPDRALFVEWIGPALNRLQPNRPKNNP